MTSKNLICVKVYFDHEDFADVAELATKAGKRKVGLKLEVLKPHGFAGETIANTKGISRFVHYLIVYYKDTESERTARLAQIQAKERELQQEKAKLGVS